ncbi:ABC transporter permease [Anaerococcus ihuae]|uniref:ABC transporter permease n=1 Tax=Anaerococcus ihuae TaxID=2899519 RepID=UPI001F3C3DD8|nr:ABC transporter permease [Anaerococcus ihuae]
MTVFKNYFKIIRGHTKAIALYTIIFMSLLIFSNSTNSNTNVYKKEKAKIYIEDLSQSDLSKSFITYMGKENKIVDLKGKNIDDNLFYEIVTAYIKIPKNFDKKRKVEIKKSQNSKYYQYVKESINLYLDQISVYEKSGFDTKDAIKNTKKDFQKKAKISLRKNKGPVLEERILFFFNFLSYVFLSQIILVVSLVSLTYKNKNIKQRNLISPMSKTKINFQIFLANISFAFFSWLLYMLVFFILNRKIDLSNRIIYLMINSLVFSLSTVSLALFISKLINNSNIMMAVMNIFSLGSSFLTGVFVPQDILSKNALLLGRIFPSFYYVLNNNMIANNFTKEIFFKNIFVLLGFAVIFLLISFILDKFLFFDKSTKN